MRTLHFCPLFYTTRSSILYQVCCCAVLCLVTQSCPTPWTVWTVAYQAPPSMGFSRQEYWSGVPLPSRGLMTRIVLKDRWETEPAASVCQDDLPVPFLLFIVALHVPCGWGSKRKFIIILVASESLNEIKVLYMLLSSIPYLSIKLIKPKTKICDTWVWLPI